MRTILLSAFIFGLVFTGHSQAKKPVSDLVEMKLNGKVRSVRVSQYEVEEKEDEIGKAEKPTSIDQYIFSETGNKIEENSYNGNGTLNSKYVYAYDEKGNKTGKTEMDADSTVMGRSTYAFDEKENTIVEEWYSADSSARAKTLSKFDNKGNKTEETEFTAAKAGDLGQSVKMVYKYDSKGNRTESFEYKKDGKVSARSTFKYNDKGDVTEVNSYDEEGEPDNRSTYKYEYDDHRNWIKKTSFKEGAPETILERDIEYYD